MAIDKPSGSLGGEPIVSAASTIRAFIEQGIDYSTFYGRANSYKCTLGPEPGNAWVLMTAGDLARLDSAQPQDLILGNGADKITFKRLAILHSQRLFPSQGASPDGLHLVQLADVRYFLKRTRINKRYNLRKYCTESDWITGTLNSGTPWTFAEIAADIWTNFSAFGSFFSGFSTWSASNIYGTLPANDPENLRFEEVSAIDALQQLCQQNGFYLRYDPTVGDLVIIKIGYTPDPNPGSDGWMEYGFGGARSGTPSSTGVVATGVINSYNTQFPQSGTATPRKSIDTLEQDTEAFIGVPYIPATVRVVFPANGDGCGSISAINSNAGHGWFYSTTKTATAIRSATLTGVNYRYLDTVTAGTEVSLYSTTSAQFSSSTATVPTNLTALTSIAERMATDYYRTAGINAIGRVVYEGVADIVPGPVVTEATYREYGDGMKTELAKHPVSVGLERLPKLFAEGLEEERWRPKRAIPVTSLQGIRQ